MVIKSQGIEPHWNYLLALDADLIPLSRYVEFDERNFDCFSIEIARILLAAAAEVDVVSKQLCKKLKRTSSADCIHDYRDEIGPVFPDIPSFKVQLPRFGLTLTPWGSWKNKGSVPAWWTACNKVKHHRATHYEQASLKHALNAVAGLFVIVLHLYEEGARQGGLAPRPQLLRVDEQHYGGEIAGNHDAGFVYDL